MPIYANTELSGTLATQRLKFKDFRSAILGYLRVDVPKNWRFYCDAVSDNFRVISPKDFRVLT